MGATSTNASGYAPGAVTSPLVGSSDSRFGSQDWIYSIASLGWVFNWPTSQRASSTMFRSLDNATKRIDGYTDEVTDIVTEWARIPHIIPEAKSTAEQLGRVGFDGGRILDAKVEAFERREQQ